MRRAVPILDLFLAGPSLGSRTRRTVLRAAIAAPALLALPGCFDAAANDLPPLPEGTVAYNENGAWETVHDQFADEFHQTLEYRYGFVPLTDYFLPRRFSWEEVMRHYDPPLAERGWRLDEACRTSPGAEGCGCGPGAGTGTGVGRSRWRCWNVRTRTS